MTGSWVWGGGREARGKAKAQEDGLCLKENNDKSMRIPFRYRILICAPRHILRSKVMSLPAFRIMVRYCPSLSEEAKKLLRGWLRNGRKPFEKRRGGMPAEGLTDTMRS